MVITPRQLKETNLIFAEHRKLLAEDSLLNVQIGNYKADNGVLAKSDSIKALQLAACRKDVSRLQKQLDKKARRSKMARATYCSVIAGLLAWLIAK